ncbi:MAG: carbohydrate ABC transporter permease [Bacillota bacterium]|nr:carbohydrate ABC transporter permease [Bacillota bacterium]
MREYKTKGRILFNIFNYTFISLVLLTCLIPLLHILALSFSQASYTDSNMVTLIPKGFTLAAYQFVMENEMFWRAFSVTLERLAIGVPLSLMLTILAAYPLSKDEKFFPQRKIYMWLFMFVMIFNAGLVPTYLLIKDLNMMDTIWALVLPTGVNVFNMVLMMNFFRGIPHEIEESALVDGARQHTILWKLYLPLAKPSIATITLFTFMNHWNSWMDGRIYMNSTSNYPLQTYLQNVLQSSDQVLLNSNNMQNLLDRMAVSGQNLRAAQLFISMLPLLVIYPFLQKYFTAGLVMGSVKG